MAQGRYGDEALTFPETPAFYWHVVALSIEASELKREDINRVTRNSKGLDE